MFRARLVQLPGSERLFLRPAPRRVIEGRGFHYLKEICGGHKNLYKQC